MSAFDFERLDDEDVMLPTVSGEVILEGYDGKWIRCGRPVEVRQ